MEKFKLLLIGKIPPPAGGIGSHLIRLMESLDRDNMIYSFFDLDKTSLFHLPKFIFNSELIHSHVSHPYLRFFIICLSRLMNKKVIFTFHGNVGRYKVVANYTDLLSFYFSSGSIVINQASYKKVENYKNVKLIPAFLPPITILELPKKVRLQVDSFIKKNDIIFCTNANGMKFDKNNKEIYGILGLVSVFEKNLQYGLIISDPSSDYYNYFKSKNILLPENILLIEVEHDFLKIIEVSNCCIRATSTDGDSLSIKESLYLEKPVICSDVVDRTKGVILYKFEDWDELTLKLNKIENWKSVEKPQNGYPQILDFYMSLL